MTSTYIFDAGIPMESIGGRPLVKGTASGKDPTVEAGEIRCFGQMSPDATRWRFGAANRIV